MNAALQASLNNLFNNDAAIAADVNGEQVVRELNDFEVLCASGGETLVNFG